MKRTTATILSLLTLFSTQAIAIAPVKVLVAKSSGVTDSQALRMLDHLNDLMDNSGLSTREFVNANTATFVASTTCSGTGARLPQQRSAKVSRLFHLLHVYGLIGKVPRSRRWRLTKNGLRVVASAIRLREQTFPTLYATAYA